VIATPNRRKTKQVCHVNLLKAYHDRNPQLNPKVAAIPADVLVQTPVVEELECRASTCLPSRTPVVDTLLSKTHSQLSSSQTEDLTALLSEFDDVFSDVPGRTTLGVHHIELKPDTRPIRCALYRLN